MSASSFPRTIAARICGYTALAVAIVLSGTCGSNPAPTPVSTTVPTTTIAATTTTTVPATTTTVGSTSTTTTIIRELDARIDIRDEPCRAPGSGQVSCRFTGSSTTGGRTPYTFRWTFTNPANNQVVTVNGVDARPELGCGFSTGVATFALRVTLTVTDSSNETNTDNLNNVTITREGGACGT
jgi:hypothetical protein